MRPSTRSRQTRRPPAWADALHRATWRTLGGAPASGGVRLDLHKALTGPLVLALMILYDVFTPAAWTYLALHGSYGVAWVIKDRTLPDKQWQRRVRWIGAVATWVFLSFYWVAPVLLVLGTAGALELGDWSPAGPATRAAAMALYALGLVLMVGADAQKNLTLALRNRDTNGGGLITTGFFARTRHPNYLGEIMIYAAFALVVGHWLPWLLLAGVWGLFFLPNMIAIDASLSRYPEFERWTRRTGLLLPRLLGGDEKGRADGTTGGG